MRNKSKKGLKLLKWLDSHFSSNYDRLSQSPDLGTAWWNRSELPVLKLPNDLEADTTSELWQWLVGLCFGDWATRLWIVQEQLPSEENVMLYGFQLLSWEAVAAMPVLFFLELLPEKQVLRFWQSSHMPVESSPWDIADPIFSIWGAYRHRRTKPGTIAPFSDLWFITCHSLSACSVKTLETAYLLF